MATSSNPRVPWYTPIGQIQVEQKQNGKPNTGKVLAAVQAHADDIPFFCAGLVAKLVDEGYTAYLIQTTNDEKCGPTSSIGDTIRRNEEDIDILAKELGFEKVIHLGYRNHFLDEASPTELRARLVYLIRALKIDTITTFNPWGQWEENPDHYVTGQAVEAARWMAGMDKDYPEHPSCGLSPHTVSELYYWTMRPGQPYNTVVDIEPYLEEKIAAMSANKSQGPAGARGRRLKEKLRQQGKRLPQLGDDDETADREFLRLFGLKEYNKIGAPYGLRYAEHFYYIPPGGTFTGSLMMSDIDVEKYIAEHAIDIKS